MKLLYILLAWKLLALQYNLTALVPPLYKTDDSKTFSPPKRVTERADRLFLTRIYFL